MFVELSYKKIVSFGLGIYSCWLLTEKRNPHLQHIGLASDGVDRCHAGFFPRHLVARWEQYDGRIAQVVDFYKDSESPTKRRKNARNFGCCEAVLIDNRADDHTTITSSSSISNKRHRTSIDTMRINEDTAT